MKHFFEKRDPWGHGMALWVLMAMMLLAVPAWWAVQQIHLENDVAQWLPASDEGVRVLDWYHDHFPGDDRIVISWENSSLDDPRVEQFAQRLRGIPDVNGIDRGGIPYVDRVVTPHEIIDRMTARKVTRQEAIRRVQGVLVGRATNSSQLADDASDDESVGPVALLVSLSEAGSAEEQMAFAAICAAATDVGIDNESLHMGGRPIAGSELNREVKKAAWNRDAPLYEIYNRSPLLMSGIVAVLLAFVMLRSLRMATVVLIVTFYTTFLTVALVPVTGGSMNMVLIVMPTLLMVLCLSAAIHVANYWKHAAQNDLRTAVVETIKMARQPCTLAGVTTAIGLLSLSTSPLQPVRDFGLYAAIGCLISLGMVLFVLPSLLQFWPAGKPTRSEINRDVWKQLGRFLSRRRTGIIAASLLALSAGAFGLTRFRTETKVIHYFPDDSRVVQDYGFLEQNLTGIIPVETVIRFDKSAQQRLNFLERLEIVRDVENQVRRHPEISGALSLADFQPVYQPLPADASRVARMLHSKKVHQIESRVKQNNEAACSFLAVAEESADLEVGGDERLNKAGDELWRITAQVSILSDLDYGDLTRDLNQISQSTLEQHAGVGHVVTGMVPLFLRTQQAVLDSLIRSFGLAFCVIGVVMMVLLRNPLAGLIAMLPNLLPVGLVFGLISWCGIAVDIGTMLTASVALGIAVDGTLHLLTWFQSGIKRGMSRRTAVSHALTHAGPAMWQTSAAVGIGLLMLAPTELLLVSRFGWLMASLIGAALVADLIFLPALLAGPLGALIVATVARAKAAEESATVPTPSPSLETVLARPHIRIVHPTATESVVSVD
jgi:predicted RND superfamily exporter protein